MELEFVVLIEDGLFCLSEMYFRIVSIAEDGSSGIGAKLRIKKYTLLNNNETVTLEGKNVENSRGKSVMF